MFLNFIEPFRCRKTITYFISEYLSCFVFVLHFYARKLHFRRWYRWRLIVSFNFFQSNFHSFCYREEEVFFRGWVIIFWKYFLIIIFDFFLYIFYYFSFKYYQALFFLLKSNIWNSSFLLVHSFLRNFSLRTFVHSYYFLKAVPFHYLRFSSNTYSTTFHCTINICLCQMIDFSRSASFSTTKIILEAVVIFFLP